jgi:adenylate cyclase
MKSSAKAAIYGLSVGAFGLVISLTLFGALCEDNFGLQVLLRLRGPRTAPKEVVIITIDKDSANHFNLPPSPRKWPRSLHANLVDILAEKKPSVIAFDLIFAETQTPKEDHLLAKSIRNAGNVVLSEWLQTDKVPLYDFSGAKTGHLFVEKMVPPLPCFVKCALASAPFILPKVPVKLNRYSAFMTCAEDTPTLPVLVFQVYALNVYEELIALLEEQNLSMISMLPRDKDTVIAEKNLGKLMRIFRHHFQQNPGNQAEKIISQLIHQETISANSDKFRILQSLIRTYQGPATKYLNFYGPPGTIQTIPYYQVFESNENPDISRNLDFEGKAIFIGISDQMGVEQHDSFYTAFSQPDELVISGVEVAATAFANLLEDIHVTSLHPAAHLMVVGLWGLFLGIICMMMPTITGPIAVPGLSMFYLLIIHYLFNQYNVLFPLIIPIFIQAPTAFLGSVFWKYFTVNKEKKNIRTAVGYYLPGDVVDQLSKGLENLKSGGRLVYGTCLVTDGEKFTALSEKMKPDELNIFLNKYFEAIFHPVRRYSGTVSDIRGDSLLVIWASSAPDSNLRHLACKTALEIIHAVNEFNRLSAPLILPTRIGIHSGFISLGNIGAIDHFEYRAAGDIVNTASRMEGLNKYLGTKVLVSTDVLYRLDGFLVRNLGNFIFAGKSSPVEVFELISLFEDADSCQLELCNTFSDAMCAYRNKQWEKAINLFGQSMNFENENGPSRFYMELCKNFWKNPPDSGWDGTVYLAWK